MFYQKRENKREKQKFPTKYLEFRTKHERKEERTIRNGSTGEIPQVFHDNLNPLALC